MQASIQPTLAALLLVASASALAQQYPSRPIRVIVPYTPGGITDVVTRIVMQDLAKRLAQNVIVDNRPGANSILGADLAAKAQPDGYTLVTVIAAHAANQSLYPKLPFHSVDSYEPISLMAQAPLILCASNALPASGVKEIIALAKAKPGQLIFASSGIGAAAHLSMEYLMLLTGIKMTHVPYKGTAPALQDLISGQVAVMFDVASSMMPHVKSGRIKGVAMASEKRAAVAPDLPTVIEAGVPGFVAGTWVMEMAPAKTPRAVVERLSKEIGEIIRQPEVKERFLALGIDGVGNTPAEARKFLMDEVAKWGKVIKTVGIKIE